MTYLILYSFVFEQGNNVSFLDCQATDDSVWGRRVGVYFFVWRVNSVDKVLSDFVSYVSYRMLAILPSREKLYLANCTTQCFSHENTNLRYLVQRA